MATKTRRRYRDLCEVRGHATKNKRGDETRHELVLSVGYSEGGTNWFSGSDQARGFTVSFCKRENDGSGFTQIVIDGRSNPSALVENAARWNDKKFEAVVERVKYPDAEMSAVLTRLYEKAKATWPEAEFPAIDMPWSHAIALYS